VFANPPLYNTLALAYSEVAVNAAASSGTGFKFGTGLTNYGGYVVRYIKTGDLVQVEGLITNVATTALALASGAVVLTGLPVPRSGSGAIMSIGLQSFTTVVPMRLNPTNGELIVGAAVTLALGNGTTTGGYIAINFSYHTT
jgi:hypothetical protein